MSLVKINCYTNNYSSIAGGIRASIYLSSEPTATLESISELTPPHNARLWSFTGLLRDDYIFRLEELDSSGVAINLLSEIALTPTELDTNSYKDDFQVIVGSTNGIVDSATYAIFDGSDGAPDFRSWDVTVTEMFGRGLLKKGVDFTFNKTTGLFTILTGGAFVGGQYFNFHFDPQSSTESTGTGNYQKRVINLITSNTNIDTTYLGSINIVEVQSSTATPINISLPLLADISDGIEISFEIGGLNGCVKFISNSGESINFPYPSIGANYFYAVNGESFSIYKFKRSSTLSEWRLKNIFGNFNRVGEILTCDNSSLKEGLLLDGSSINVNKFARLYDWFKNFYTNQSELRLYTNTTDVKKFSKIDSSNTYIKLANYSLCTDAMNDIEYPGITVSGLVASAFVSNSGADLLVVERFTNKFIIY